MKTTIDIPDDLYRRLKVRSAMEGRPLRSVAIELFQKWIDGETPTASPSSSVPADHKPTRFDDAPWLAISRKYIKPGMSHDMDDIRVAIAKGWGAEIAEKLNLPASKK